MSNEVYITRASHWGEGTKSPITQQEWQAALWKVEGLRLIPEKGVNAATLAKNVEPIREILDWAGGNIVAWDPNDLLISKMVQLARVLDARVQSAEGESYQGESRPPMLPLTRIKARFRAWLQRDAGTESRPPFQVGAQVTDLWGQKGVVQAVEPAAENGVIPVLVRFADGRVVKTFVSVRTKAGDKGGRP
jgi:hypothetical protein